MRRCLRVFTLALIFATAMLGLAACKKTENHTHTYADAWSANETHHWKEATCEHKEEKLWASQHILDGGKKENGDTVYTCMTCSYTIAASAFRSTPISVSLVHSYAPAGVTVCVEGYYVGVAEAGWGRRQEILLKDTESDAIVGVTGVPSSFGTWPDVGYQKGDLVRILGVVTEEVYSASDSGSQNKCSLTFSSSNPSTAAETILSRANSVSYSFSDAVTLQSQADFDSLFNEETLSAYTYVHFKGRVFLNYLTANGDGVVFYRPHMNGAASAAKDIKPDGKHTVGMRENVLIANVGAAWEDYFREKWVNQSVATSIGYFQDVDFYAVYTGVDSESFQLTVLDGSWLRPVTEKLSVKTDQDALMEMANAYLRKRGLLEYDQYNGRRMVFATPEEASAQSYVFLDCSSYVTSVYYNTFGIKAIPDSYGSQNTKNYTKYAKENHGNADCPDVVGYWETMDYKTEAEQQAVLDELWSILQPGDILVYRRGSRSYGSAYNESNLTGHAMLYMGDGMFSHSTGTSWNGGGTEAKYLYKDDPEQAGDRATTEEYYSGTVQWLSADAVLAIGTQSRMLFGDKNTFVYNFSILRPLERKDANPTLTEQAQKRMAMAGLSFEKLTSAGINSAVFCGQEITYTLTVKNHGPNAYRAIAFTEMLASGVTLVNGNISLSQSGDTVSGTFDIGAYETKEIVWTVKVGENLPFGTVLCNQTAVGGLKMKAIENTVSAFTAEEFAAVAAKAREYAESGESFADPMEFISRVYTEVLGYDRFSGKTTAEVLASLFEITGENRAVLRETGEYLDMVAPHLYGGSDLYSTTYAYSANNALVRTVYEHHLTVGDVILCEWYGSVRVYIYLGEGLLASVDSETQVCTLKENGSEKWVKDGSYYYQRHLLASCFSYQQYAVLRPQK